MTIRLQRSEGVEISAHDAGSGRPLQYIYATEKTVDGNGSTLELNLDSEGVGTFPGEFAGSTLSFATQGYDPVVIRGWNGEPLDLKFQASTSQ